MLANLVTYERYLEGFQKKGRDHAGAEAATHGGLGYFVSYLYGHFMIFMWKHIMMNMQSFLTFQL